MKKIPYTAGPLQLGKEKRDPDFPLEVLLRRMAALTNHHKGHGERLAERLLQGDHKGEGTGIEGLL